MASRTVKALIATIALGAVLSVGNGRALAKGPGGGGHPGGHPGGGPHVSGGGHPGGAPHVSAGGHPGGSGGHGQASAHLGGAHRFSGAHLRASRSHPHGSNRGVASSGHFAHSSHLQRSNFGRSSNLAHAHNSNLAPKGQIAHDPAKGQIARDPATGQIAHDPVHDPHWNQWGTAYSSAGWSTGWNAWNGGCCEWWSGSVFWPYFYGDLLGFVFWPVEYYYPFWFDPYVFVWDAIFWPDPYDNFYVYGPSYYREYGDYDIYGDYGYYENDARARRRHHTTRYAYAKTNSVPKGAELAQSCGGLSPSITDLPTAGIESVLHLTGEQLAALDALRAASSQASEVLRVSCSNEVPMTPVARLDAVQKRTDAMIEAIRIVRAPLDNFYNSLTQQQRQQFAALGPTPRAHRRPPSGSDLAALCNPRMESFTQLPVERIDQFIRPTEQQKDALQTLKTASTDAANELEASCPAEMPQDPIGRFDAVAKRLDAISKALKTVRPALDNFYASLTDEQKARFNTLGPPKTREPRRG